MRAVLLHEYGGPTAMKYELDVPKPALGADTVLIQSAATSVNPSIGKSVLALDRRISR